MNTRTTLILMTWLGSVFVGLNILIYSAMGVKVSKYLWGLLVILGIVNVILMLTKKRK